MSCFFLASEAKNCEISGRLERDRPMERPIIDPLNGVTFWVETDISSTTVFKHSACDNITAKVLERKSLGAFFVNPQSKTLTIADTHNSQLLTMNYHSDKPEIRYLGSVQYVFLDPPKQK